MRLTTAAKKRGIISSPLLWAPVALTSRAWAALVMAFSIRSTLLRGETLFHFPTMLTATSRYQCGARLRRKAAGTA